MHVKKVLILGGGFAGLNAAKTLSGSDFDVWIIDQTNHHLFQPLLYEVATAALSPSDIALPIREILSKSKNITVLMGEVVSIRKDQHMVVLRNGDSFDFDYLIIALGAKQSYFGHEEWKKYAPSLKTLSDALKIRERILISFEKAERCNDASQAQQYLNFIIIGGGPTGVEMAGAIAEIAHKALHENFRHIDPTKAKIYLFEGLPRILPSFPESLSRKAKSYLEKFGIQVLENHQITQINDQGITVNGILIPSQNIIWAAGNAASPVLKTLEAPLDRHGRVVVDLDLSLPNYPEIFVIGDAASVQDSQGHPLPQLAPVAIQQGRYVGKLLRRHPEKSKRKPFKYFDKGMLAAVSKTKAIGSYKKLQLSGFSAWMVWGIVHITYLMGLRNRITVLVHWLFSFFTGRRGARLIYRSIDEDLPKR